MQASIPPPETPWIGPFLNTVDWLGEQLGVNVPPITALEPLRSLPPATLGRSLAAFLDQHRLSPFTTGPRRKQLHDAVHVLTGYETDAIGEAEVQAFLLGTKFHLAHILLGLGLLGLIARHQSQLGVTWSRLWNAYQRGQTAYFDVDVWQPEEQWHLPLSQVQTFYGIHPVIRSP